MILGVGRQATEVIVAEIGRVDMTRFPVPRPTWRRGRDFAPGNDQSAGKRRSGRTTKGSQWLRTTLVQVAWAASHTKDTKFAATYHRCAGGWERRRLWWRWLGKILTVVHLLLKEGASYEERGTSPQAA